MAALHERKLVVIGGDAAGMSAASKARRLDPEARIIVLEQRDYVSYSLCGTPYYIGGVVSKLEQLVVHTPDFFREKRGLDVRTGHRVLALSPWRRTLQVRDLATGVEYEETYDRLLIATGARPKALPCAHDQCFRVYNLRSLEEADAIRARLTAKPGATILIVGASYIGLELVEAALNLGANIHLVDLADGPMFRMAPELRALLREKVEKQGVHCHFGVTVSRVEESADQLKATLSDGSVVEADLAVAGVGIRPNSELADQAGLRLDATGGILVDRTGQTSNPQIFAAGDCAMVNHLLLRQPIYMPLGTVANKQGRVAGANMAGERALMPGILGTSMVKFLDLELASTGLSPRQQDLVGYPLATTRVETRTQAGYYPGSGKMTLLLYHREDDGLLVGGELVGAPGSAARINTVAAAITAEMTVQKLGEADLGYSPPFSLVYDPVTLAANLASKESD